MNYINFDIASPQDLLTTAYLLTMLETSNILSIVVVVGFYITICFVSILKKLSMKLKYFYLKSVNILSTCSFDILIY